MKTIFFTFVCACAMAAAACSGAQPSSEDSTGSGSAVTAGSGNGATRSGTCVSYVQYMDRELLDREQRSETFNLTLAPNVAADIAAIGGFQTADERFTVAVTSPDGKERALTMREGGKISSAMIANTWKENKTYRIKIDRTNPSNTYRVNCYLVATQPNQPSGINAAPESPERPENDQTVCKVGGSCLKRRVGGNIESGTCDNTTRPNLSDDTAVGFCL